MCGPGAGSDEAVAGQAWGGQQEGGEGIEGTLGEQDGGGRGGAAGQPETATVTAGAGGKGLEGGRAGADEFGTGGIAGAVAAGEDGIVAAVGVERAGVEAALEQGGIEAAGGSQEVDEYSPLKYGCDFGVIRNH